WCMRRSMSRHGCNMTVAAARLLVDLVDSEMGQLDQELAKLAVFVGPGSLIDVSEVDRLVGNSRTDNAFKILDAIGTGQAGTALSILDRVLQQGDDPLRVLGAFSLQLRRLAQAARLNQHGLAMYQAFDRVGVPPFARRGTEQQLRQLGPQRIAQLLDWLVET